MLPEVVISLVSASVSSVVGGTTLMITHLSRQRTERIKHAQDNKLERERLRFISEAYEQAAADGQAPDLVDLTLALHGNDMTRQSPMRRRFPRASGSVDRDAGSDGGNASERMGSPSILPELLGIASPSHPDKRRIKRRRTQSL
jgi:hypothetical protein